MAPAAKSSKVKEMFKPYNEADVPDIMPFPDLATFAASNGEHIAVPKLNQHQRSYILDVALRNADLGDLGTQKEANEFYDQVKTQALDAKAFQHKVQPGDRAEEASLSERINTWKLENPGKLNKKAGKPRANDGDASDDEEDEGGRKALLCGYTKAGWRKAIISNKRSADNVKNKVNKTDTAPSKPAPSTAVTKLLGLAALTGCDKFREDCHDEIQRFSQTLPGDINAGGKFAKAEAILWAKEDKASWDAMLEDEEVDWEERQKLVASGFKHMFQKLHTSGKFRPFMATMLMGWLDTNGNVQLEWCVPFPFSSPCIRRVEREEVERLKRETERKKQQQQKEEVARLQQEEEAAAAAARLQREEAERLKREAERKKQENREKEGGQEEKKSGRKRKAEVQLVPEDAGDSMATRRPSRTRKTPQEAEKERQEKLAAEVRGVGKPSWDYVARSPVKAARGSTRRYEIYPFNPGHGTEDSPRRT
ncbi:hypothetical protein DFH09DRAFT_1307698 [Mycena vulgaris]|nr:hypothetical protein DFH09DRAFT_1307698 [Mycena vulgaris]